MNGAHSAGNTVEVVGESEGKATRPAQLVLWLAFLPPLILGLLILKYGVDVMDWDQWKIAALFQKASNGALTFADLAAQQGEFRQFFPNLIFISLGWLTHWNIRYEMLVTFSLACVVAFNLYRVAAATLEYRESTRHAIAFITSLLIFSPAQYENWLHGEQIIYLMPAVCFTTALRLAYSDRRLSWSTLVWCVLLCIVATFSSPNGIVCWIVLWPVLFANLGRASDRNWRPIVWLMAFALSLALYLSGYHKPSFSPPLDAALRHPLDSILFFVSLLGAPLLTTYRLRFAAAAFGSIMTVLFAASFWYVWRLDSSKTRHCLLAWLAVGAYSIVTAIIVTVARVGYGLDQAFSSRYGGFFVYLAVSLCWLVPQVLADLRGKARAGGTRFPGFRPEAAAAAFLILVHVANSAYAVHQMSAMRMKGLQDKACMLLVNVVDEECPTRDLPEVGVVKARTNAMNELGYLRPGLVASNRIADIEGSVRGSDARAIGRFESLAILPDGTFAARGRAGLPESGDAAHAVLLAYEREAGNPLIFAIAEVRAPRFSLARALPGDSPEDAGWQSSFAGDRLPAERPIRVSAWAFDALAGKAYPLEGSFVIASGVAPR